MGQNPSATLQAAFRPLPQFATFQVRFTTLQGPFLQEAFPDASEGQSLDQCLQSYLYSSSTAVFPVLIQTVDGI